MKNKRYRKTSAKEELARDTETQRKSLINRKCHENEYIDSRREKGESIQWERTWSEKSSKKILA